MSEPVYLTSNLPGTGGRIREQLEDFIVEELPLYEPSGVGEHLYVTIQKAGLSTHEAIRNISGALRYPPGKIGYAGLKDARALTRQTLSLQGLREDRLKDLEVRGVEILAVRRHKNKLRIGHLKGNRFVIRIRGVGPDAAQTARECLDRLAEAGVPNLFGPQRFGSKGDSDEVGRAIVNRDPDRAISFLLGGDSERERDPRLKEARRRYDAGDLDGALSAFPHAFQAERRVLESLIQGRPPEVAIRRVPKAVLRLVVSAYQARLFNRLVTDRMPDLGTLLAGDLAYLHDRGAVFSVTDPEAEQPRADAMEISPSAPLFGKKVLLAEGVPGENERAILEEERLDIEAFRMQGLSADGERRPVRVPLSGIGARPDGDDAIVVSFELPKGSFATSVLREVMKVDEPGAGEVST